MSKEVLESTGLWDFKRIERRGVMYDQRARYDHDIKSFNLSMSERKRLTETESSESYDSIDIDPISSIDDFVEVI